MIFSEPYELAVIFYRKSKKKIMFCKFCGNKIDDNSLFCSFCGKKQSEMNKLTSNGNEINEQWETKTVDLKDPDILIRKDYFNKILLRKSFVYYLIFCFILTFFRYYFAISSYKSGTGNSFRYPYIFPGQLENAETMYGNQQDFLFRALKIQTIYLSSEEQSSYLTLFFNLFFSNVISLSFFYIIILICIFRMVMKVKIE